MQFRFATTVAFLPAWLCALLVGCATTPPQLPLDVSPGVLTSSASKVAVVMAPLPKVDTEFPGAGCLLCLAAASLSNKTLTEYVQTLPADDLKRLPEDVATLLHARGVDAIAVTEPLDLRKLPDVDKKALNFATKNFSSLKAKYRVDKVLVIDIQAIGVWRN